MTMRYAVAYTRVWSSGDCDPGPTVVVCLADGGCHGEGQESITEVFPGFCGEGLERVIDVPESNL